MQPRIFAALLAVVAPAAAFAVDCTDKPECWPDGSAMHTALAAQQELDKADRELNATYQRILKALPEDASDNYPRRALIAAQREWVKYRDTNCAAIGEVSGGVRMWKSAFQVSCEVEMTKTRTEELTKRYESGGH